MPERAGRATAGPAVKGCMLNYEVDGHGPPLLLIHGFGISFNIWRNLRPSLRSHFTLIMIEVPGIGRSPAPDAGRDYLDFAACGIEGVRRELEIERWLVLSYSSGTRLGEHYVVNHASSVGRAVFLCPAITLPSKSRGLGLAVTLDARHPWVGNWILSGWRLHFLIKLLGFSWISSPYTSEWTAEAGSQPVQALKDTIRSLPEYAGRPFAHMPVPSLFVYGSNDYIVDVPVALSAHDRVIRAAHSAPMTEADQVAQVVLPFLLGDPQIAQISQIDGPQGRANPST
jgi:pimeloyl-ACP methyl ester carboxylesterase